MKNKKKQNLTPKEKEMLRIAKKLAEYTVAIGTNQPTPKFDTPEQLTEELTDKQSAILRQYAAKLISTGTYGQSKNTVLDTNIIDLSNWEFMDINQPSQEILNVIKDWQREFIQMQPAEKFLFLCPCFPEGILRIHKDRYVQWKVKSANPDTQELVLWLHDYNNSYGIWEPGVSGTVIINSEENASATITPDMTDAMTYAKIYTLLSPKSLGWSEFETKLFTLCNIQYAETYENSVAKLNKFPTSALGAIFIKNISLVNMALHKNKPKIQPTAKKTSDHKTTITVNASDKPERRVRTINTLSILSKKPPRMPTRKSVINYSLESWACRGHIRKLKSGKLVPVKASVHHRKALANSTQDPVNTTIILKG